MYFSVSSSLNNRILDFKKSEIETSGEDSCNANILSFLVEFSKKVMYVVIYPVPLSLLLIPVVQ